MRRRRLSDTILKITRPKETNTIFDLDPKERFKMMKEVNEVLTNQPNKSSSKSCSSWSRSGSIVKRKENAVTPATELRIWMMLGGVTFATCFICPLIATKLLAPLFLTTEQYDRIYGAQIFF